MFKTLFILNTNTYLCYQNYEKSFLQFLKYRLYRYKIDVLEEIGLKMIQKIEIIKK